MNPLIRSLIRLVPLVLLPVATLFAQGTKADYQRMGELGRLTAGKVFRVDVAPSWLPGGHHFWYRIKTGVRAHEFVFVDLEKQIREPAFDHIGVADQLAEITGRTVEPSRLPFQELRFSADWRVVYFRHANQAWKLSRTNSMLSKATDDELAEAVSGSTATSRLSKEQGEEMEIEFFNESPGEIRTFWIDRRGRRIPYESIRKGESFRQHTYAGHVWLVLNASNDALALFEARAGETEIRVDGKTKLTLPETPRSQRVPRPDRVSPDDRFRARADGDQFAVIETETGERLVLGRIKDEGRFFDDKRFYWAPDSRYVVAFEVEPGEERQVYTIESSPQDQMQPKLHQMTYPKPGDRLRVERPRMFDVQKKKEVLVDGRLVENPWKLTEFRWRSDSSEFSFLFNQRGHQVMRLVSIDPASGTVRSVIEESADTFIDYTNKVFTHYLEAEDAVIWMSERDGWNHLYQHDWRTGEVVSQITRGQWVVRGVDRVDEENRQIWFRASGMNPDEDPYYIHHCRIDFDGSNLVTLTAGDGTHSIQYSPNREYLIDTYSRVDQAAITDVRKVSDGSLVCHLENGDLTALRDIGWRPAIPFSATGRDGVTKIYGVVYLPTTFDEASPKEYPVIESIYAGPHGSFVPKRFTVQSRARAMAELGFIVVQIDGMGTNNRSKAFHDICWQNLGDSGFPDRILWLQAAARKFPQMDLSRVGIYGGSAGGQSALRALLAHGDFYKVAVADCGCHDNRMDKVWWNEQWMGWPVGPHYAAQSNVTNAHKLDGKLLLIVGELDRNVDPASTLQVVNALIKANKDFDFLLVPGAGHGIGSGKYGLRRTRDFFVRHLHGVEPRSK